MKRKPATSILPHVSVLSCLPAWLWLASAVWPVSGLYLQPRMGIGAESTTADWFEDDPRKDGWTTEILQSQVGEQWNRLAKLLASSEPPSPQQLKELITDDFHCQALRPENLETAFRDPSITILRRTSANNEPTARSDRGSYP